MTKKALAETIARSMNCPVSEALEFISVFQASLIEALQHEGEISLHGFGSFKRKTRAARTGRNPKTGETLTIPEREVVQFKASKNLLDHINPRKEA